LMSMPSVRAASRTLVPLGTVTVRSSIFSVTVCGADSATALIDLPRGAFVAPLLGAPRTPARFGGASPPPLAVGPPAAGAPRTPARFGGAGPPPLAVGPPAAGAPRTPARFGGAGPPPLAVGPPAAGACSQRRSSSVALSANH